MSEQITSPSASASDGPAAFDQEATPYTDALLRHREHLRAPYMIPGHSAGMWGESRLEQFLGAQALSLDIPQLLPGVDLEADSPFAHSRRLAAEAWDARQTWFLTNGASQGNRMALMAVRALGDVVIAQRSSHSSMFDGLVMSGLIPRFVMPTIDNTHNIAHGVTPASIERALREAAASGSRVAAVAIVSPSYFGTVADVAAIARVCHQHAVPLIVDASWGAHFGFHERFPESPTRLGATIVISSVHKLGGSLTQTALLHLGDDAFAPELQSQLERAFRHTESTSPSSLLLASLDIARSDLATNEPGLRGAYDAAQQLRRLVEDSHLLRLADPDFLQHDDVTSVDPLHVAIDIRGLKLPGTVVKSRLAKEHGIFIEIAAETIIVALIGATQTPEVQGLVDALHQVADSAFADDEPPARAPHSIPPPGERVMSPRAAYLARSELVQTDEAIGRISADVLAAYPPGVPSLVPGERITSAAVNFLRATLSRPAGYVRGAVDPSLDQIRVVIQDDQTEPSPV